MRPLSRLYLVIGFGWLSCFSNTSIYTAFPQLAAQEISREKSILFESTTNTTPPSSINPLPHSGRRPLSSPESGTRPKRNLATPAVTSARPTKTQWLTSPVTPSIAPTASPVSSTSGSTATATPVVRTAYFEPQPPNLPTMPPSAGSTLPPSSTLPPGYTSPPIGSSSGGISDLPTTPPGNFGGSSTLPPPSSTFPPTTGTPTGGSTSGTFPPSNLPSSSNPTLSTPAPTTPYGLPPVAPPAASYPRPGTNSSLSNPGVGNVLPPTGSSSMTNLGGGIPTTNLSGTTTGSTFTAPQPPRFVTGEPFVTLPPPQYEMPYTHVAANTNACLPLTQPARPTNGTGTTNYSATNPMTAGSTATAATTNPYPGVPGYIVPPTITPNMAPNMFTTNNSGYTSLFNWGTESSNVTVGRGLFGTPTAYVSNEPFHNFFRYMFH